MSFLRVLSVTGPTSLPRFPVRCNVSGDDARTSKTHTRDFTFISVWAVILTGVKILLILQLASLSVRTQSDGTFKCGTCVCELFKTRLTRRLWWR